MVKANYAVGVAGFKTGLAYKLHYFVTLLSMPISLLIYYFLWSSIYTYMDVEIIRGFTLGQMITYYVMSMIVGSLTWSNVDEWIEENVISGEMVASLLKPMSFMSWNMYFNVGLNTLAILIEIIPVLVLGFLFGLIYVSFWNTILAVISVFFAAIIYFLISYIVGLSAFWLKRISGLRRVKRVTLAFLSGSMIPLTFFPLTIQTVFKYLPFQYVRYVPISIYLGNYTINYSLLMILISIVWVVVLYLLSYFIWIKAFKKFAGAGV